MDAGFATVIAAAITGVFGVIIVLIQQLRKENRKDHATVTHQLRFLIGQVARVDQKVDGHIQWHGEGNGRTTEPDTSSANRKRA
jgi:hypothetical protein